MGTETPMRFREGGSHIAALKAEAIAKGVDLEEARQQWNYEPEVWNSVPPAEPGDVWQIRWYAQQGEGPIAGYAICCPGCGTVHHWTTALNCHSGQKPCPHEGKGSCWTWTGSAQLNTLNASPSLQVVPHPESGKTCNWHGFLTDGVLRQC